mmetsp:Transcript_27100/g.65772  ORF Transcript_27100/g.65772 Transcript_27100/m.65772 type:complete len:93 (-) Transcript_27100:2616-2894(-)
MQTSYRQVMSACQICKKSGQTDEGLGSLSECNPIPQELINVMRKCDNVISVAVGFQLESSIGNGMRNAIMATNASILVGGGGEEEEGHASLS